jgi:hypothetical protein
MILLAFLAAVLGIALGWRFSLFTLIPAIGVTSTVAMAGWVFGNSFFEFLLINLVVLLTFLQLGYLGGAALGFAFKSKNAAHVLWPRGLDWRRGR